MNTRSAVALAGAVLAGATAGTVRAADSDIYANRVPPALSQPLVMFSVDARKAQQAVYAGCTLVGAGAAMCAPAKYFRDNCPSCVLPTALASFTYFDAIRLSMRMALLQTSGVQVGLMLNHGQDAACAGPRPLLPLGLQRCSNGAYVAAGIKPVDQLVNLLTTPSSLAPGANLSPFLAKLDNLPAAGSAPWQGKELFFEYFRYLTGQGLYNGHNGYTDYGTNNTLNLDLDNTAASWDVTAEVPALGKYLSPLTVSLRCSRLYTINFLMDVTSNDGDSDAAITAGLAGGGMDGISLAGASNKLATVVGWLHDADLARSPSAFGTVPLLEGTQNVTSYFYVPPTPRNSSPATFDATTTEYASSGGTTRPLPLGEDPAALVDLLRSLLGQVVSVSTTFVAPSLATNAFNRAETLDSVYLTLFQPDLGLKPFWPGNVKKLKLKAFDTTCAAGDTGCTPGREVRMVDANGSEATSSDGRIRQDALTFWSDGSTIAADPANGVIAGRDGRAVTLGGAGSRIPGTPGMSNSAAGARQLYLYASGHAELQALNADLTTAVTVQGSLGVGSTPEALALLTYIRGYDFATPSAVRPWLMGDPMHSRPLPINYGALGGYSKTNPAIYIAVNTNDGFLHFIRNTTAGGAENGGEAWAFMPFEMLAIQQKLALNAPTPARVVGFDGVPTAYMRDVNGDGTIQSGDGDRAWLYAGMRRGGRVQYALDVTDPTVPKFQWRIGNDTIDFPELGYTFSQPRVARVRTGSGASGVTTRPAVFFGGGYDPNKDYTGTLLGLFQNSQTSTGSMGTDDSMGNAIYVVDAETGALIWKAVKGASTGAASDARVYTHVELKDSIPSALTVVDTDGDGNADRILVGDTGGNLWRADLKGDPRDWTLTLVAQLGRHAAGASAKGDDRRFFHEPDLVLARDAAGPYDAIVIGSGDREDPLDYGRARSAAGVETFTENGLYVIKDRRTAVGSAAGITPLTPTQLTDVTSDCLQTSGCTPDLGAGWRVRLTATPGEKILSSALTAANRVYFTSYLPPDMHNTTSCTSSEGSGLFYTVSQADGTASFNYNTADGASSTGGANSAADRARPLASAGIPASPVYVNVADSASVGGSVKCVLASDLQCRSGTGATRFRTFWNRTEQ